MKFMEKNGGEAFKPGEIAEAMDIIIEIDRSIAEMMSIRDPIVSDIKATMRDIGLPDHITDEERLAAYAISIGGDDIAEQFMFLTHAEMKLRTSPGQVISWISKVQVTTAHRDPGPNLVKNERRIYMGKLPENSRLNLNGYIPTARVISCLYQEIDTETFNRLQESLDPIPLSEADRLDEIPVFRGQHKRSLAIGDIETISLINTLDSDYEKRQLLGLWNRGLEVPAQTSIIE